MSERISAKINSNLEKGSARGFETLTPAEGGISPGSAGEKIKIKVERYVNGVGVLGKTYPIKETLKKLGFRWNMGMYWFKPTQVMDWEKQNTIIQQVVEQIDELNVEIYIDDPLVVVLQEEGEDLERKAVNAYFKAKPYTNTKIFCRELIYWIRKQKGVLR